MLLGLSIVYNPSTSYETFDDTILNIA